MGASSALRTACPAEYASWKEVSNCFHATVEDTEHGIEQGGWGWENGDGGWGNIACSICNLQVASQ